MKAPAAILLLLGILGCTSPADETYAPRRHAYPRIKTYGTEYADTTVENITLKYNASLTPRAGQKGGWLDIPYPRYGGTLHVTVTPGASMADYANRRQRIILNLADTPYSMEQCSNGTVNAEIAVARGTTPTPVQFVAADAAGNMVSGAWVFAHICPDAPFDSISPIVEAVHQDIIQMWQ